MSWERKVEIKGMGEILSENLAGERATWSVLNSWSVFIYLCYSNFLDLSEYCIEG